MAMFSGPTEHAANPPETWEVRKAGERLWQITTKAGTVIDTTGTRTHARDMIEDRLRAIYEQEGRWYAGDTPDGWLPWATVRAEKEASVRRIAGHGRAGHVAAIERLTASLRGDHRALTLDVLPADVTAWARDYAAAYPCASESKRIAETLAQIDAHRAELDRLDALVADFAAA